MPFTDRQGAAIKTRAQPADKWRGSLGLNLVELGFLNSWAESTFELNITRERLAEMKAAGFDFIRLPFNPTYLLNAASDAERAQRWQAVDNAIGICLQADLKVYLNNHIWTLPADNDWPATAVLAAYPNGSAWLAFEALTTFVAAQLLKYDPAQVAYGQFNEVPGSYANWNEIALRLYTAIRAVNPEITVFVSGDVYSGPDNLIGLDPSLFTGNVRFAFTPYDPQLFTHRRVLTTVPYDIPLELNFPPVPSQKSAIVAAMETNVDNDASVTDKAGWKATLAGFINDYIDGRNGLEPTWLARKEAAIAGWCRANGVDPADVIISEIGCSTGALYTEAPANSNLRWFAGQRRQALRHGFGGIAIWAYQLGGGEFSPNTPTGDLDDGYLVSFGGRPLKAYTGRMQRMVGLTASGHSRRVQDVMNAASERLDRLGLWDKLSLLYFWGGCADSPELALYNWKDPDRFKLTITGAPIFERNKGWRSAHGRYSALGVGDDLLNTGFIPGTSDAIYTRNANHMGVWLGDGFPDEDFSYYVAGDDFGQNFLGISGASMSIGLAVTNFSTGSASVSDANLGTDALGGPRRGHYVAVREDASNITAYKNGNLIQGSVASASAAFGGTYPIKLLRTVRSLARGFHMGGKLTAQNVIDVYTVFDFIEVALDDPS